MTGSVPSEAEVKADFAVRKGLVDAEAHNEREAKRQRRFSERSPYVPTRIEARNFAKVVTAAISPSGRPNFCEILTLKRPPKSRRKLENEVCLRASCKPEVDTAFSTPR